MRKILVAAVTLAAFGAVACSDADSPTAVDFGSEEAQSEEAQSEGAQHDSHTWQSGESGTWHGYHAPSIAHNQDDSLLCATWDDDFLFTRKGGEFEDADHFSYGFEIEVGDEWEGFGEANGKKSEDGLTGCVDLSSLDDGTYRFRVKGMAKDGTGQSTTTHHTESWVGEITIGTDAPAAPAVAAALLNDAGIAPRYGTGNQGGNYVSEVADEMGKDGGTTYFRGIAKENIGAYECAVATFLNERFKVTGEEGRVSTESCS